MLFYNLGIRLYALVIRLAALKNVKAKQWVSGRKNWEQHLKEKLSSMDSAKRIWIHCASYGEFEQGRPLIESIKLKYPEHKIILSFFSPSGYEPFKNWKGADVVCYLPLDTKQNANTFIELVKPNAVLFIKYEFWVNFLFQLKQKSIPTYLISAVFKRHHPFFKWYGNLFRRSLDTFTMMFIQDDYSAKLLKVIKMTNYEVIGDTRFDRVVEVKKAFKEIPQIVAFKGNSKLIVAGSTWIKDEQLVTKAFEKIKNENVKLLLVPHDIHEKYVNDTVTMLNKTSLSYSLFTETINNQADVLVLNTMGLLSKSYFYADCAYIGGGFSGGLHNCLEASVYGVPVTFYGDQYSRYNEVFELLNLKAAISVKDEASLEKAFRSFLFGNNQQLVKQKLEIYFNSNHDISGKILNRIKF